MNIKTGPKINNMPSQRSFGFGPECDSGLLSLVAGALQLDIPADASQIWHTNGMQDRQFDEIDIRRCASRLGIKTTVININPKRLLQLPLPAIVKQLDGYYVLLHEITNQHCKILDSVNRKKNSFSYEEFLSEFSHNAILLCRGNNEKQKKKKFGFSWFWPSVKKHSSRYWQVAVATLCIHAFTLAGAKISEVVIDTVLVSRGLNSLDVLAIGFLGLAIFEPFLSYWRSIIYAYIASCVSSELSARLFRQMISLPLSYFRERRSGDLIARVRELDQIRNFITGSALIIVLDLIFVGTFLVVMYGYSPRLTIIIIISIIVYFLVWMVIAPLLRTKVERQYNDHASNSAFLTETVTGIETVKALAVGEHFSQSWERQLSDYLKSSFQTNMTGNWAGCFINFIQKCIGALLLLYGVKMVIAGDLSVGALVAFNTLSGHITTPVLRLAQIWPEFQRTSVSLRRLGEILDHKGELNIGSSRSSLEKINGDIEFRKVTFRYSSDGAEVLRRFDLTVRAGESLGVTGLSGSGKSTITKLVQKLYTPQSGQVLVDGMDLGMVDPVTLRRQMGIVLQENFLFNGSFKDNILLGNPVATMEEITDAARLAGALTFIEESAQGFDTPVGERGSFLSGGQRQRIALARALVANPAILILDEATSALDYESEAIILENLPKISENRTVIIIAHRLNGLRACDRIIVMEHGEIVQEGKHDELVNEKGRYLELWLLQVAGHNN